MIALIDVNAAADGIGIEAYTTKCLSAKVDENDQRFFILDILLLGNTPSVGNRSEKVRVMKDYYGSPEFKSVIYRELKEKLTN